MRYMSLTEMLDELRVEARISQNVAHGVQTLDPFKQRLRRIQEELYLAYDWPHLNAVQSKTISAGQRTAAYPDKFIYEGVDTVYAKGTDARWQALAYGVGARELNIKDSDADERDFPIRHWQNYLSPSAETISANMFEVWPIPSEDAVLRFEGRQKLFPLTADADKSSIDGPLVVLHAAAEILAAQKAEDASLKLQKAIERMRLLKLRQRGNKSRKINLAGRSSRILRPGLDYIPR